MISCVFFFFFWRRDIHNDTLHLHKQTFYMIFVVWIEVSVASLVYLFVIRPFVLYLPFVKIIIGLMDHKNTLRQNTCSDILHHKYSFRYEGFSTQKRADLWNNLGNQISKKLWQALIFLMEKKNWDNGRLIISYSFRRVRHCQISQSWCSAWIAKFKSW